MKSLGTLLVKHGWITKQQLGMAISKQREIGGRLGTCLLEMGAVEEELLDRCLAEQQGVPVAPAESLKDIADKVTQILPAPIAIRYRAIPFRAGHSEVDIAMLEVDNLWLQDELSFIVGRRLNAYIASEIRIAEALSTYYGAPLGERFAKLVDRLNRAIEEKATSRPHPQSRLVHSKPQSPPAIEPLYPDRKPARHDESEHPFLKVVSNPPEPPAPVERPRTIPLSQEELVSLRATSPSLESTLSAKTAQPPYSRDHHATNEPSSSDVDAQLQHVSSPGEVGSVLLAALGEEFTRVMLFKVSSGYVRGWMAQGPGLDCDRLDEFRVSFEEPSIFLNLREGGSFYLGQLPEMPVHQELARCWSQDLSSDCVVFPIRVRERLVTLVYGDRGPLGLAELDLNRIRQLTAAASNAFEVCILKQKDKRQRATSA